MDDMYDEMVEAYSDLPASQACRQTLNNLDYRTLRKVASSLDMAGYPNDRDSLLLRLSDSLVFLGPVGDPSIYQYIPEEGRSELVYNND